MQPLHNLLIPYDSLSVLITRLPLCSLLWVMWTHTWTHANYSGCLRSDAGRRGDPHQVLCGTLCLIDHRRTHRDVVVCQTGKGSLFTDYHTSFSSVVREIETECVWGWERPRQWMRPESNRLSSLKLERLNRCVNLTVRTQRVSPWKPSALSFLFTSVTNSWVSVMLFCTHVLPHLGTQPSLIHCMLTDHQAHDETRMVQARGRRKSCAKKSSKILPNILHTSKMNLKWMNENYSELWKEMAVKLISC